MDTPQWRALLRAEIQSGNNKLDKMAQRKTRKYELQAKHLWLAVHMQAKRVWLHVTLLPAGGKVILA